MQTKRDFMAELNRGLLFQNILERMSFKAFAEEGEPNPNEDNNFNPQNPPSVNFEQMIAQARKEEKEKLYPRIKKAEEENKSLTASINKYLLEIAALKDEIEKYKNNSDDSNEVKELKDKITNLENENKTLKENTPNEEDIRRKIEAEFEVKMYAQEQINANKDSIISILIPEITGKTKEEIDSAIASAKEKTKTIKKDLGIDVEDDDKSKGKKTPTTPKQKKAPVSNPSVDNDGEEFDADYIRNLDPRSKEYAEFRRKMGLK